MKANRIVVRHELGHVLAVIELISPGNKNSKHAIRSIIEKLAQLLREGINLLVIDLFPPFASYEKWADATDRPTAQQERKK